MEKTLIINSDLRTVSIPDSIKNLGVQHDDDVLRLHFSMPKMYGDIDLSAFHVRIIYMNASNEGDVYPVVDSTAEGENITFSWLVSRFATKYKGNVRFIVCLRELDEAGDVSREFNTTPASLPVLEGLETSSVVVQQNPDILEHILLRLSALEQGGAGGQCGDCVKSVNGQTPDENGNVQIETGGSSTKTKYFCFFVGGMPYKTTYGTDWDGWINSEYNYLGFYTETCRDEETGERYIQVFDHNGDPVVEARTGERMTGAHMIEPFEIYDTL